MHIQLHAHDKPRDSLTNYFKLNEFKESKIAADMKSSSVDEIRNVRGSSLTTGTKERIYRTATHNFLYFFPKIHSVQTL